LIASHAPFVLTAVTDITNWDLSINKNWNTDTSSALPGNDDFNLNTFMDTFDRLCDVEERAMSELLKCKDLNSNPNVRIAQLRLRIGYQPVATSDGIEAVKSAQRKYL
jgi:hypothetical protein